ncbi:hypothetical protein GOP47_0004825 [Adiantum capillus-veneris]|uniref:Uncharacterized protein n=1 Tax=Adiantum capillus-veneris TaxID=13818 RepID=A0A9D4ZN23_ADICA|nr:hypothetical protein GOP47_0004825 [Adiantum capillus-veneris]
MLSSEDHNANIEGLLFNSMEDDTVSLLNRNCFFGPCSFLIATILCCIASFPHFLTSSLAGNEEDNNTMHIDGDSIGEHQTPPRVANDGYGPSDALAEESSGGIKRNWHSWVGGSNIKELMDSMKNLAMVLQSSEDRKDACEDAKGKRLLEIE